MYPVSFGQTSAFGDACFSEPALSIRRWNEEMNEVVDAYTGLLAALHQPPSLPPHLI